MRVVLRRRLSDGGLGDVLGYVERWSDGEVVVRTRTGTVLVREVDLVAAKRVPEPPVRRSARTRPAGGEVGPAEQG